ncbi:MAG: hypothetical protein WD793_01420 [Steroidobacteraceae bacterium]
MKHAQSSGWRVVRSRSVILLVGALAFVGAVAQGPAQPAGSATIPVFQGTPEPPPEQVALDKQLKEIPSPPQRARGSVQELVDQIARQAGGREKLDRARAGGKPEQAIAAADREAPDVVELERQKPPAPPKSARPSRTELEAAIAAQAGGREKLQRARQGGRPDQPPPRASLWQQTTHWLAGLPSIIAPAHAAGELSLTLTPATNAQGAHGGLSTTQSTPSGTFSGYAVIYGALATNYTPNNTAIHVSAHSRTWDAATTSRIERPYVYLSTRVPTEGYYIVNTRAYAGAGVQLRRYVANPSGYAVVQTFDASGTVDRPALIYLTAGYHVFYWVFPSYFAFYSASIDSYP